MGSAELDRISSTLVIRSHIVTYGTASTPEVTEFIRTEIETMWNEPDGHISISRELFSVRFDITAMHSPNLLPEEIFENNDPRNNYFRIEEFAIGNISFVDGLGCNTGYFKLDNLYQGSTTAAHEYGHTIGLEHPTNIDLRGKGVPGIMYPRGTLVDPPFQYNPAARSGDNTNGGTMHPMHRRVKSEDIQLLRLHKLSFSNDIAILGEFSSIWHPDQSEMGNSGML